MTESGTDKSPSNAADGAPLWRRSYDALESTVGPQLEQLVGGNQFAQGLGAVLAVRKQAEQRAAQMSRRVLHGLNLPAGTDVTRLLTEIGELRKQVRELAEEIENLKASSTPSSGQPRGRARG